MTRSIHKLYLFTRNCSVINMSAAFLDSRRRIPQTSSFRNSGHVPAITQHAERIIPHMVPRAHLPQISGLRTLPSSSLPTSSHDPGLGILGCHSLGIMFPLRNGWRLTLASVQFGLYPNAHTISSACLLALSGKHVPGCSAC